MVGEAVAPSAAAAARLEKALFRLTGSSGFFFSSTPIGPDCLCRRGEGDQAALKKGGKPRTTKHAHKPFVFFPPNF
jgi:hypothetical protein